MALTAANLKSAKQAISNVPDVQVRIALSKMLDVLADYMNEASSSVSETVTLASTASLTVVDGLITVVTPS